MLIKRFFTSLFLAGITVLGAGAVSGQNYPLKLIRIVTLDAGGANDFASRLIAQGMSGSLGQQVIVDNRGGTVPGEIVAKAPPDGYTLTLAGSSFWIGPLLQTTPYDPVADFVPISLTNRAPNVLVVHPSLPVKSVKELIALAKARPGELNYASGPAGGPPHLAAELFKAMGGVNIVNIPYKGGGPALIAVVGGQVQLMFGSAGTVTAHIKSGRLRALAVTSAEPSVLAAGLPTLSASGLPGYVSESTYGVLAPARTPDAIVNRLNQEIVRTLKTADMKEKFLNAGSEPVGSSPQEFGAAMKTDIAKLGKLIRDVGIKNDQP